jgi:hypothetical protein
MFQGYMPNGKCTCNGFQLLRFKNKKFGSSTSFLVNIVAIKWVKFISRFSEYLPVTFKGFTENVYLVVHDLTPSGIVIHLDKKLKKIFCLTEWHVEYFTQIFPSLKNITEPFYYGIDFSKFKNDERNDNISFNSINDNISLKQQYKNEYSQNNCDKVFSDYALGQVAEVSSKYKSIDKERIETASKKIRNQRIYFGASVLVVGLVAIIMFSKKK